MEGHPVLFVYDLHVQKESQRKGLGRHLMSLLELIARKQMMIGIMAMVPKVLEPPHISGVPVWVWVGVGQGCSWQSLVAVVAAVVTGGSWL